MGLLERLSIRLFFKGFDRRNQDYLEHHLVEINNYLRLLRNRPEERDIFDEDIRIYLEDHLPKLSEYFGRYFPQKVTKRFERKHRELQRAYESYW